MTIPTSVTATRKANVTEPVRVGELLPGGLAEVVDRAGHDCRAELVAATGYCARAADVSS